MASRLDITIYAKDLASRQFRRVAQNVEKAEQRINAAMDTMPKDFAKNTDQMAQQAKQNAKVIYDAYGRSFSDTTKDAERMGDQVNRVINNIRDNASQGAKVPIEEEGAEQAAAKIQWLADLAQHLPKGVLEVTTKGLETAIKQVEQLDAARVEMNTKRAIIDISTTGVRETLKALVGIRDASLKTVAQRAIVEIGTRGWDVTINRLLAIKKARMEAAEVTDIDIIVRGGQAALAVLNHVKDAQQDVDGTYARIKAGVTGAEEAIRDIFNIQTSAQDIAEKGIEFLTRIIGGEDILKDTEDLNDKANDISQGTISFLTELLGSEKIIAAVKALNTQANRFSSPVEFITDIVGEEKVTSATDAIKDKLTELVGSPWAPAISLVGANVALDQMDSVRKGLAAIGVTRVEANLAVQGVTTAAQSIAGLIAISYKADSRLQELRRTLIEVDGVDPEIAVKMTGSVKRAQFELQEIAARLNNIGAKEIAIRLGTTAVSTAMGMLENYREVAEDIDRMQIQNEVQIQGMVEAMADFSLLDGMIRRLNGRTINLDVDATGAVLLPKILGDSLAILEHFQTTAAAVHAVTVPTLIGGIGALAASFSTLAAAAASAGVELAPGLVGAVGAVGGAIGAGTAGLFGYVRALQSTYRWTQDLTNTLYTQYRQIKNAGYNVESAKASLDLYKKGTEEYENALKGVKLAQQQQNQEIQKFAAMLDSVGPKTLQLNNKLQDMNMAMIKLGGAIREATAPFLIEWLGKLGAKFDTIRPKIFDFLGAMNKSADAVLTVSTRGTTWNSFIKILDTIGRIGPMALTAVGHAGIAMVNILAVVGPAAIEVAAGITRMTVALSRWTQSAEGQEKITKVWNNMYRAMQMLWGAAKNLGAGLMNVFSAMNQARLGSGLLVSVVSLSSSFHKLTEEGTRGHSAMVTFFTSMRPILSAAASLLGTIVQQAARVVFAVTTMGTSSGKLNPMVDILQHIEKAVPYIADLIIHNFSRMGPLIGPLLLVIAKLARTFLASIPPLEVFIRLFTSFGNWLTSFSMTTQRAIMGVASWGLVIAMLGRGPLAWLLGGLLRVVKFMMGPLSVAFKTFSIIVGPLIGLLARLTAAFAGPIMKVSGFLPVLMSLGGPIGLVVAAIGALVIAGSALVVNWDKLTGKMDGSGSIWSRLGTTLRNFVTNGIDFFREKASGLVSWLVTNWPKIKSTIVSGATAIWNAAGPIFQKVWNLIKSAFQGIMDILPGLGQDFMGFAQTISKWMGPSLMNIIQGFSAMAPILKPLGALIGGLLLGSFQALWPIVKIVAYVVGTVLMLAFRIASEAFVGLGKAIGWIGTKLAPFSPLIHTIGQVIGWVFATVIAGAVGKTIQAFGFLISKVPLVGKVFSALAPVWKALAPLGNLIWKATKLIYNGFQFANAAIVLAIGKYLGFGRVLGSLVQIIMRVVNTLRQGGLVGVFRLIVNEALDVLRRFAPGVYKALKSVFPVVERWLTQLGNYFQGGRIQQIGRWVISGLWAGIKAAAGLLWSGIKWLGRQFITTIKNIFGIASPAKALIPIGKAIVAGILQPIRSLAQMVGKLITNAKNTIVAVLRTWSAAFKTNLAIIKAVVQIGFRIIQATVQRVMAGIKMIISGAWKIIKGIFTGDMSLIKKGVQQFAAGLTVIWTAIKNGAIALFKLFWAAAKALWDNSLQAIKDMVSQWAEGVHKALQTFMDWARKAWESWWKNLKALWDSTLSKLKQLWSDAWDAVSKRLNDWWDNAKETFNVIKDGIRAAFVAAAKGVYQPFEEGFSKLKGVWNGIMEFIANALDKIGADDMAKKVRGMKFGDGGATDGTKKFAKGGHTPHFATGTQYMYGEDLQGGQREYFLTENKKYTPRNYKLWSEYGERMKFLNNQGQVKPPRNQQTGPEGQKWYGAKLSGTGGASKHWPPKAPQFRSTGADSTVNYSATGAAAQAASAGAAMWRGLVKAGGTDVRVMRSSSPLGGGRGAYTTPNGEIWLGPGADAYHAGHEFGHTLGLGHGGNGIMGGMGRSIGGPSQGDFDAIASYYGTGGGSGGTGSNYLGRTDDTGAGSGQYGPTNNSLWDSETFGRVLEVLKRFRVAANTYENHPPGVPGIAGKSADFWDYAGRGTPISVSLGNEVRSYITRNLSRGLSWTLGEGDAGHSGSMRHVHATWKGADPTVPNVPYRSIGGGDILPSKRDLFLTAWNALIQPMINSKVAMGPHVLGLGMEGFVEGPVSTAIRDKIASMLSDDAPGGGSTGVVGGSLDQWLHDGLAIGGAFPPTAGNVAKLHSLAMEESSGNPKAVNYDYTGPDGSHPSGLLQMLRSTFNQYMVPGHPDIFDPVDNTGSATRYMKGRYGYLKSHAPYKKGGRVPGQPGIPQLSVLHGGERVLPADVTALFDSGISAMRRARNRPAAPHRGTDTWSPDRVGEAVRRQPRSSGGKIAAVPTHHEEHHHYNVPVTIGDINNGMSAEEIEEIVRAGVAKALADAQKGNKKINARKAKGDNIG